MKCSSCRADNREDANFCLYCGKSLDRECVSCGRSLPAGARFCDGCGADLNPPEAASVAVPPTRPETPRVARKPTEGERKLVTVLFVDVVNYTGMSERLDPEEVHQIVDESFKLIGDEINRYEGTIIQYTGDGVMAVFGAPLAQEEHGQRACYAALGMHKVVASYAKKVRRVHGLDFLVRVGINSGLVIVGPVGDDPSMDYSALGDTTNVASRLQSMAKPGSTFVSGDTYRIVKDFFLFEPIGKVTVKGKEKPLDAYELVAVTDIESRLQAASVKGLTRFVGRRAELDVIRRAFDKAQGGSGQVIGVVGEAGIGKSRLVLEFKNMLHHLEDHTYLEAKCLHFGSSIAYLPILDALRSYFDIKEGQSEAAAKSRMESVINRLDKNLSFILPPLHDILSMTVESESYMKLDPKTKRQRIFEAIKELLVSESRNRCLVLAVDNLMWIDKTSESFLSYLIGMLPHTRILIILLYRPEYNHSWGNKSCFTGIGIDRLPVAAGPELIASLLRASASPQLNNLILNRAGGNPLFIEELTYSLLESGQIEKANRDEFVLSRKMSEIRVPHTIQGIIAARIDRLSEHLKKVLQIASVIGRDFTVPILAKVSGNQEALKSALLELQELEFVYEKTLTHQEEYKFKHDLVHEVVYNTLLLKKRRELHEAAAGAIEALYSDRLEEFWEILAYHYMRADNRDKAYEFLRLSGKKAMENCSLFEAFHFYRDGIDIKRRSSATNENKEEQIRIRLEAATPMISLGFPEDSLKILQEGEELAREIGSAKSVTKFCSMIGLYYSVKGELLAGVEYGEACFATAQRNNEIDLMAAIAFDLCSNYAARGEHSKIMALAPELVSLLEQNGMTSQCFDRGYNVYSALLAFSGFSTGYMGNVQQGRNLCEKGIEEARVTENLYSLGLGELLYGYLIAHQACGLEAEGHFRTGIGYLEKGQIFVLLGLAWTGLGRAYHLMGRLEEALGYMAKGLKIHTDAGVHYNTSSLHCFLAGLYYDLGKFEKAKEHTRTAFETARRNGEKYYEALSLVLSGRLLARSTETAADAERSMIEGIGILDGLGIKNDVGLAQVWMAELLTALNEADRAWEALTKAEKLFAETGAVNWLRGVKSTPQPIPR